METSGNGKSGKYTAQQFIDAIPGTGGVISAIAARVGCAWNTAKKYIDNYATVRRAWQNERNRITDMAQDNIIRALESGDVQMSKWWVQVMDTDFSPPQRIDSRTIGIDLSNLSVEQLKRIADGEDPIRVLATTG